MMDIVPYSEDHAPHLVRLMNEFHAESLNDYGLEMHSQDFDHIESGVKGTTFVMLKDGVVIGVISGTVVKPLMSNVYIYQEIVWYVDKEHRRYGTKLLDYLEEWCAERGVGKIVMVCMCNSMAETLGKFYERKGYRPMEVHYIKDVEPKRMLQNA